ncbi:MAG: hypothetical protein IJN29_01060 [Akkermansia sp.]|nr:hypothetical protein [Akkermansia sp.]
MSEEAIVETGGADVAPEETVETVDTKVETTGTEATETAAESGAEESTEEAAEEAAEFAMEWPEGYEATEQFASLTTEAAKAVGITDGKLAGAYTAKVIQAIEAEADKRVAEDDAALKADWGADYAANKEECQAYIKRMSAKAGLSEQDVAVLATPKGMRLIQAMRTEVGEGAAAVGKPTASAEDEAWAKAVMSNPNHADYKAFHNPSDPRWRSLNARYNRVKGF